MPTLPRATLPEFRPHVPESWPDGIAELLAQVKNLPPPPKLLPQLLSALADLDCDIRRVVELITYDPVLTAKLLQICNSAIYGFSLRVTTVAEAVNRIGFHGVYHLVAVLSGEKFMQTSETSALDAEVLWRHAVSAAFAAQFIAERIGADSTVLFTAGLLHDIGKIPLAEVLQGEYACLVTDTKLLGRHLTDLESASFGFSHAEIGARLLQDWEFPGEFVAAVRFHHAPVEAGAAAPLAACLELADLLAHRVTERQPPEAHPALDPATALRVLGLSSKDLLTLRERVLENLQFVEALCAA